MATVEGPSIQTTSAARRARCPTSFAQRAGCFLKKSQRISSNVLRITDICEKVFPTEGYRSLYNFPTNTIFKRSVSCNG